MKLFEIPVVATSLLGICAVLGLEVPSAHADFTFGEPVNLGPTVNSPVSDGTPSISADGLELYFLSLRPGGLGSGDIWVTTRATKEDDWGTAVNLGATVNSSSWELCPYISSDGLTLYFASLRPGGYGNDDLYVVTRATKEGDWSSPVNLGPVVNASYYEFGQCLSADGLELYFAAYNRPGGHGELDLWVTTRETTDDDWSQPVNLGPTVNSPASEGYPSMSTDGLTLFFSDHPVNATSRPGGYGGTDLWMTTRATRGEPWGQPVNLGPTINSSSNEDSPSLSADGSTLYFESGQPGVGSTWDLWQVKILPVVDFNGDGRVDGKEVLKMAESWGQGDPAADIDPTPFGDGIVDVQDLTALAEYIGKDFVDPTLVAHWALDEAEGLTASDSAGDNDATVVGGAIWRPGGGKAGGALEFDGVDDFALASSAPGLRYAPFSIVAWIKGGAPGQTALSLPGGTRLLHTNPADGSLMTDLGNSGRTGTPLFSDVAVTDGNWHRVGLIWDGADRILCADDQEVARDPLGEVNPSESGLIIGADGGLQPGSLWKGLIDDVRIYSRVVRP